MSMEDFKKIPQSLSLDLDGIIIEEGIKLFNDESVPGQEKINFITEVMKIKGYYRVPEFKTNTNISAKLLEVLGKDAITAFSAHREPYPLLEETKFTIGDLKYEDSMIFHHPHIIYNKEGNVIHKIFSGPNTTLFNIVVGMITPIGSKFIRAKIEKEAKERIESEGLWLEDPYKKAEELKNDKTSVNIELDQSLNIHYSNKDFSVAMRLNPRLSYKDKWFEDYFIKKNCDHLNIITDAYMCYIKEIQDQKRRIEVFNMAYEKIPGIAFSRKFKGLESAKRFINKSL